LEGGEKMNMKIFGIIMTLIIGAILVTPVFAEPTKGQKVPVRFRAMGYYSYEGDDYSDYTNNGNIRIRKNLIVVYDPLWLVFENGSYLVGSAINNVDSIMNLDEKTEVSHYDSIVSFETPEGGFKGEMQAHHKNFHTPDWTLDWHFVLQGFGAFEGQTLQIRLNGPYPGTPATGYLLKP
jgi:hypothetical protein